MAIELFKPFVMKKLVESGKSHNIKSAKRTVERMNPIVWDILEEVIKDHPVMLNRAPTLHRLSIQAFEPVLIDGRAIKLHPLVCGAFNADFDGDQMSVHVPLSIEAQAEARFLMLSSNNILKLSDGKPVMSPTQDMVLGCYYLTIVRRKDGHRYIDRLKIAAAKTGKDYSDAPECYTYDDRYTEDDNGELYTAGIYSSEDEAMMAYQTKTIGMQDEIFVRRVIEDTPFGKVTGIIKTTVGKLIFNGIVPQDLGFTERKEPKDYIKLEIDNCVDKSKLKKIVDACFRKKGSVCAANTLDNIKNLGYKYSTVGSITTSVFDMKIPDTKREYIDAAGKEVIEIEDTYKKGFITDEERYKEVVKKWSSVTDQVTELLKANLDEFNPIWMMANSGARGSIDQIKQLAGMRGLMTNPNGKVIEIPVKSSFREGLSVLEYFISSHGGRKGLADTALKTADSGYLTRRLVDVAHHVIVREDDCFASLGEKPKGMVVSAIRDIKGGIIEKLEDRITGRYTIDAIENPTTHEIIVPADSMISEEQAKAITAAGIESVLIRSVFTCRAHNGVCAKCYGKNMSTNNQPINIGEAVGIIAAQSIGEPGTQLTMRTFHTGGIASTGDITQGLPRVEELFEARKPKGQATVCEVSGTVKIEERDNLRHVVVETDEGEKKDYIIPFSVELRVKNGERVEVGRVLTGGSVYPQDILKTSGPVPVQDYILREVQSVYRSQGVDINDKHVEVIVRQMLRKVRVENCGDTDLLPGEYVDIFRFEDENKKALEKGGKPANAKRVLLGITKAALATESFLSAASFQETAKVLTEAAIKNKVDPLVGLKENVIIGKLIPAGTGVRDYKMLNPQIIVSKADEEEVSVEESDFDDE